MVVLVVLVVYFLLYSTMAAAGAVIALNECRRFIVDCLRAVGAQTAKAEQLAELLVSADYRGHYSHGLNRLGKLWIWHRF